MHKAGWRLGVVFAAMAAAQVGMPSRALGDLRSKMPQPSILYVEYAGSKSCASACAETPFGRMLNQPGMNELCSALFKALEGAIMQEAQENGQAELTALAKDMALILWRRGFVIDVLGASMTEQGPTGSLIIAAQLDEDAADFVASLESLMALGHLPPPTTQPVGDQMFKAIPPPMPGFPPIAYGVVDGMFALTIGVDLPKLLLDVKSGAAPNLASNPSLAGAMKRIGESDRTLTYLVHADVTESLRQGRSLAAMMTGTNGFPPMVENVIEELGLNGMSTATVCGQIADKGFRNSMYLATTGERKGLLKLANQKPLTDDDLLWIPKDAAFASAVNFNAADAFDEAMRVLGALPFDAKREVDEALAEFKKKTGLGLREDILSAFADSWAVFDAPSAGGGLFMGVTLVVEVEDAEAAGSLLQRASAAALEVAGGNAKAKVISQTSGDATIHFVQFEETPIPVAPAWSIHNNRLVIGLMPQTVRSALDRVRSPDARDWSILANQDFLRGRKLLPETLISVGYVDSKRGVTDFYPLMLLGSTAGVSAGRGVGMPIDASMIPTVTELTYDMFGDVSGVAVVADGITLTNHGPWPIAVPSTGLNGLSNTAVALSLMLPSLKKAREVAKRTGSAANMTEVWTACCIYAYEHQEKLPPSLELLVEQGYLQAKQLRAPGDSGAGASYKYVTGLNLKTQEPSKTVMIYESWPGMNPDGVNVLFLDGHIELMSIDKLETLLEETRNRISQTGHE